MYFCASKAKKSRSDCRLTTLERYPEPVHTGKRLVVEFQARLRHANQQPLRLTGTSIAVLDARIKGITAHTFRYASRQHIVRTRSHSRTRFDPRVSTRIRRRPHSAEWDSYVPY